MRRPLPALLFVLALLVLLWLLFGCAPQAQAQDCAHKTGNNASLIVTDAAPGTYTVTGSAGCVGSHAHAAGAGSLALAVWADDPTTAAVDGATEGEPLTLYRDGHPLVALPNYSRDAVVWVATAPADSILAALAEAAALLDSLETAAQALRADRDAARAEADEQQARADYEARRAEAFKQAALDAATERNAARDSLQTALAAVSDAEAGEAAAVAALEQERAEREALIQEAVAEAVAAAEAENAALRAENAQQAATLAAIAAEVAPWNSRLARVIEALLAPPAPEPAPGE